MTSVHRVASVAIVSAIVWLLCAACLAGAAAASVDYLSASFVDGRYGWIAGIDNVSWRTEVWRTTNGGATWNKVGSSIAAGGGVGWVAFVSRTIGVWGNGSLMRTIDGASTWRDVSPVESGIINEVSFAGEDVAWAATTYGNSAAGGEIAKTVDGGVDWKTQKAAPGDDGSGGFSRVSSPSVQDCYALKWGAGEGVWATSDGGEAWAFRALPHIDGGPYASYWDIDFPGEKTGWAVGDAGTILKTNDGGETWKAQVSGVSATLYAVDFVSTTTGFVVGKSGRILRTRDGGSHWVKLGSGTQKRLSAVCFVNASRGWVVGSAGVRLRTTNGGRTWQGQH
jgi:photosystem II stability/assembly factor-like uncharacterized protein